MMRSREESNLLPEAVCRLLRRLRLQQLHQLFVLGAHLGCEVPEIETEEEVALHRTQKIPQHATRRSFRDRAASWM